MIKSKPCSVKGCEYPRFAKKLCKAHQHLRTDKNPIKKRAKAIKKVSKKQERSNRAVKLAKLRVMQDWIQEHGYMFCSSCGIVDARIDMSHLIAIGEDKSLEGNELNILPQCGDRLDGKESCHAITERGDKKMKDFKNYREIMARIKKLDPDYYRKLFIKHNS